MPETHKRRGSELFIEELGWMAEGLHRGPKGMVFVERALPGERVRGVIWRDDWGSARASDIEVVEASPYRRKAPCPHYESCGGCSLQHATENFYRDWKLQVVKDVFRKLDLRPQTWETPVFVGGHNRRRATFAVHKTRDRVLMGYYKRRTKQITDIKECGVAHPRLLELREKIRPFLKRFLKEGKSADLFLQIVGPHVDLLITGPVGGRGAPDAAVLKTLGELLTAVALNRISWRAREKDPIKVLLQRGSVSAKFGEIEVNLPPFAFLQPTPEGESAIVSAVMQALPGKGRFADLFSGCGTISGPMLARGSVDAFESNPKAVAALKKSAGERPLRAFQRDLFKNPLRRDELNQYDAVVFDPPRAGAQKQALNLAQSSIPTIIGVSCNPATFGQDAVELCRKGYRLHSVKVIDQFLYSHAIELVGVFRRT